MAASSCVVLVPFLGHITHRCEEGLRELERRGHPVWRLPGHSDIARGRSMIATSALHAGFEELLWIDSDIAFDADAVETLRAHDVSIVAGVYPQKGKKRLCVNPLTLPTTLTFGEAGGLAEVAEVATGFLLTRRAVYDDVQRHYKLPRCKGDGAGIIPFFHSLIDGDEENGFRYLSEDLSFCVRARAAGHKIFVDTTIRLWHVGDYAYSWEDAGAEQQRFASYSYTFEP
jgi:hypothetical protein